MLRNFFATIIYICVLEMWKTKSSGDLPSPPHSATTTVQSLKQKQKVRVTNGPTIFRTRIRFVVMLVMLFCLASIW